MTNAKYPLNKGKVVAFGRFGFTDSANSAEADITGPTILMVYSASLSPSPSVAVKGRVL